MPVNQFEGLDSDLQFLILCQVDSVQSLYDLIRASRTYLSTFRHRKVLVLNAVVKLAIVEDVLPDAMSAVHANRRDDFIERRKRYNYAESIIPYDILVQLCRLSRSLDYFIDDFAHRKIKEMVDFGGLNLWQDHPQSQRAVDSRRSLSVVEKGRLQRAFCRVQCFVRITIRAPENPFPHSLYGHDDANAVDVLRGLIMKLGPWEVEEMCCIRDYFRSKLLELFRRMDTNFVDTHCWKPESFRSDQSKQEQRPIDWRMRDVFFSSAASDIYRELCVEWFIAHGITYLHQLFSSAFLTQNSMVLQACTPEFMWNSRSLHHSEDVRVEPSLCFSFSRNFLAIALSHKSLPNYGLAREASLIKDSILIFEKDSLEDRNEGWVWSKYHFHSPHWNTKNAYRLRQWGYVFWDRSRISASGVFHLMTHEVQEKCKISKAPDRRWSAQERLGGVTNGLYQLPETWVYQYGESCHS